LNYKEFIKVSERSDKSANDNVHYFSKIFARPTSFILFKLGLTPNLVTFAFLVVGVMSGILFKYNQMIIGYLFWRFHIVLDMADGSIARATKNFSPYADGFDKSNHVIINTLVLLVPLSFLNNFSLTYMILVSFNLYYLFDRFYYSNKRESRNYSIPINFLKDLISLEGYVLISILLIFNQLHHYLFYLIVIYSFLFISLFFLKLRSLIKK
jgi:phosphatidylglycerophosphate synthase